MRSRSGTVRRDRGEAPPGEAPGVHRPRVPVTNRRPRETAAAMKTLALLVAAVSAALARRLGARRDAARPQSATSTTSSGRSSRRRRSRRSTTGTPEKDFQDPLHRLVRASSGRRSSSAARPRSRARRRHQGHVRHDPAPRRPAPGDVQPPARSTRTSTKGRRRCSATTSTAGSSSACAADHALA